MMKLTNKAKQKPVKLGKTDNGPEMRKYGKEKTGRIGYIDIT